MNGFFIGTLGKMLVVALSAFGVYAPQEVRSEKSNHTDHQDLTATSIY
ncbi:MAG: hypothetical protein ACPGEF_06625 [Endozoicomonas sp.]